MVYGSGLRVCHWRAERERLKSFYDFRTENGSSQGQHLAVAVLRYPRSLNSEPPVLSHRMHSFISFKIQLTHKNVNSLITITNKNIKLTILWRS